MIWNLLEGAKRLQRAADIAAGIAVVAHDPLLRAQLLERMRDGHVAPTINAVLDDALREGRISQEQAAQVREKLGIKAP